ncbi:MAG: DUF72 domain-containing protein [Myxococcaceae bacterium]|nr:DUF72 domain-containing protein [Myxococcaceae bacterium]MCI0673671.1 DUF72 domain-containing protein [Myxococcaceae bacterium]
MAERGTSQLDLFGSAPDSRTSNRRKDPVLPAPVREDERALAARLPASVRMGTSSWSFPGWTGLVWARDYPSARLAQEGLTAYAERPLLRAVGVDRTFYAPVPADALRAYADAVPEDFRFVVKAHDACTVARFPAHPRYGALAGQDNPRFLDAAYAAEAVVAPYVEGLGEKGGVLVFQFPPQSLSALGGAEDFPRRLHGFLSALPRGPLYAVEVRNAALLTPAYAAAMRTVGACHALAGWPGMPSVAEQAERCRVLEGTAVVVRWMLNPHMGLDYEEAKDRYAPFARLVDEDSSTRDDLARLCAGAARRAIPVYVTVNNKAEGSAPLSVERLAARTVELLKGAP